MNYSAIISDKSVFNWRNHFEPLSTAAHKVITYTCIAYTHNACMNPISQLDNRKAALAMNLLFH